RGLHAADFIIAPSRAMLASTIEHYGEVPAARAVIPNGIETSSYAPAKKRAFVFSAGRLWDPAKNVAVLEEVAGQINWPIYVAGDLAGPSANTRTRSNGNNFRPLGVLSRKDTVEWMATASIYCAPARYEPFGLSILEAALSRCALVLGDIPSLREIWDDAALYVSPDDHAGLRRTLLRLVREPDEREQLARRALQRAQRYAPRAMADAYLSVYRSLRARAAHVARPSARVTDFN